MIKTDINGAIGVISIDRPPVNAINPELVSHLTDAFDSFKSNDDVNGVTVITTSMQIRVGKKNAAPVHCMKYC